MERATGRRSARRALVAVLLGTVIGVLGFVSYGAAGQGGNEDCPAGTTQVAKFNWDGTTYVEEGGPGPVTITNGTATGGDFTSTVFIRVVIVKGGSGPIATKTIEVNGFSGSFDNSGLLNAGGNVPDVSNVKFCTGEAPTTTTTPTTTTRPTTAGAPAPAARPVGAQPVLTG
ncbi:MAG: hypothetical protein H0V95_11630 [Actinobacteria bacterium]|nr:hypothetical protein [Actinomycetota bacterium]